MVDLMEKENLADFLSGRFDGKRSLPVYLYEWALVKARRVNSSARNTSNRSQLSN